MDHENNYEMNVRGLPRICRGQGQWLDDYDDEEVGTGTGTRLRGTRQALCSGHAEEDY